MPYIACYFEFIYLFGRSEIGTQSKVSGKEGEEEGWLSFYSRWITLVALHLRAGARLGKEESMSLEKAAS